MSKEELARSLKSAIGEIKQTPEFKEKEAKDTVRHLAGTILRDYGQRGGTDVRRTEMVDLEVEDLAIKVWLEDEEYGVQGGTELAPALKIRTDLRSHTQETTYFFLNPFGFKNLKGEKPSYDQLQQYIEILKALENHYSESKKD